ncbi:MAG: aminotransferase class V-fold PLP-dependent enzyme [Chloroflexi bacterium]|nr:aminotransferase class V-fold PLP-dependent enzyme [Chloroflexota bacterium]
MNFEELRATIPAMSAMAYLNSGWAGPSPQAVVDRMREAALSESARGPAGPEGQAYANGIEVEAKAATAGLLNVNADDVLLTHGTTEGVNIVLHGIAFEPGDVLLTSDLEHSGIRTPAAILAQRRGIDVRTVSIPPDADAAQCIEAVTAALTPDVKLIALSHIMFTCGLKLPAKEIVQAAHDAGAMVLLDGAQTAGHIQLDLKAMDVDFYASSGQKWLMGPTGTGSLYTRPDRRGLLTPVFNGEGLDHRTGDLLYSLASQGVVARAGYAEAIRIHMDLGEGNVEAHNDELAAHLRAELASIDGVGINGPTEGPTASAITAISVEGWDAPAFAEALWERHRVVARYVVNPAGVRFCTAACNDESDVATAVNAVRKLVKAG